MRLALGVGVVALVVCMWACAAVATPLKQVVDKSKHKIPVAYTCGKAALKDLKKDCETEKGTCDAGQCLKKCTYISCKSETIKKHCMTYCAPAIMQKSGCDEAEKPNSKHFAKLLAICDDEFPPPTDPNDAIKEPPNSLECRAACTAYCSPFICSLDRVLKTKCDEMCGEFKYINSKCQAAKVGPC